MLMFSILVLLCVISVCLLLLDYLLDIHIFSLILSIVINFYES